LKLTVYQLSDYPAFGSPMPTRQWSDPNSKYKYGFNGMEKDDDINVNGGSYDFGARIYDSRLGRWLSLDPLSYKKAFISPFVGLANNPTIYIDINGEDEYIYTTVINSKTGEKIVKCERISSEYGEVKRHLVASSYPGAGEGYYEVDYYNIYHEIIIIINEDGSETTIEAYTTLGHAPVYTRHWMFQWMPLLKGPSEGSGDATRKGGARLSSKDGGISPVKTKCKNGLDGIPIGDLLTALGATGQAGKIKDLTSADYINIIYNLLAEVNEQSKKNQNTKKEEEKKKAEINVNISYKLNDTGSGVGFNFTFPDQKALDSYKKKNPTHKITIIPKKP